MTSKLSKKAVSILGIGVLATQILTGCGGPSKEAKVATAIQTMMADVISANIEIFAGRITPATAEIPCSVSGSFRAGTAGFGIDPSNPLQPEVTLPIIYTNCVIKACGETLTLKGNQKTNVKLSVPEANQLSLTLTATDEEFEGVISGTQSFSYRMNATSTSLDIGSLQLLDTDPAAPLVYEGHTYSASELNALSDGC